jgi:anti-anti-sigma factor
LALHGRRMVEYGFDHGGRSRMSLTVSTEQRPPVVVISVAGELDMATAPQLQTQITELLEQGHARLVFDLAEVSFCDSTGLSVFVRAKNSCDEMDGIVRLAAPQRGVLRILQVSGLVEVLQTYPTVDEAVTADASPTAVRAD